MRKNLKLEQISSIKKSAQQDIYLHQNTKDKVGIQVPLKTQVCPAGQNLLVALGGDHGGIAIYACHT